MAGSWRRQEVSGAAELGLLEEKSRKQAGAAKAGWVGGGAVRGIPRHICLCSPHPAPSAWVLSHSMPVIEFGIQARP